MKKTFTHILQALCWLAVFLFLPRSLAAQDVAKDTISFTTNNVTLEDDPNHNNYSFTLLSPDGHWKVQLSYWAESMFGTFGDDDFQLTGEGKYYNFARDPKNDMIFVSFKHLDVTVTDELTAYHIQANGLASNNSRFLIDGYLPVVTPTDTITVDMGYCSVMQDNFYGSYQFHATNDDYEVAYGILSDHLEGDFYTADLLKPEITVRATGELLDVTRGFARHTQVNDTLQMQLDVMTSDLRLYRLNMYHAKREVEVIGEQDIVFYGDQTHLEDHSESYGFYLLSAQNDEWAASLALLPSAFDGLHYQWDAHEIVMAYTYLIHINGEDYENLTLENVKGWATEEDGELTFFVDYLTPEGMLYHVAFKSEPDNSLPEPTRTINIDFGQISVLDYSTDEGVIGLGAAVPDQYQLRLYLYADALNGQFHTSDMVMDRCDVMVVNDGIFSFHDAWKVNASFTVDTDGVNHATVDLMTSDYTLYHSTFIIPHLDCLDGGTYDVGADSDVLMVALQQQFFGDIYLYQMQLQNMDEVYDDDYQIVGDGHTFSFQFFHEQGIGYDYDFASGSLSPYEPFYFYEQGCEVRMGLTDGQLSLTPVESLTIEDEDFLYHTSIYQIEFQATSRLNATYQGSGQNYLLCIDAEGEFVEVTEPALQSLTQILDKQGYKVEKVLQNGKFLIISPANNASNGEAITYSADGVRRHRMR